MSDESSKRPSQKEAETVTYEDAHALRDQIQAHGVEPSDDVHTRPTLPFPTEEQLEERVNPFRRRKKRKAPAAEIPSSPHIVGLGERRPRVHTQRLEDAVTRTERHLFSLPAGFVGERWRLDLGDETSWAVSCVCDGALHVVDHRLEESVLELDGEEPSAILHVGMQTYFGCTSGCLYRLNREDQSLLRIYEFVRHDTIVSLAHDARTGALLVSTETAKMYRCDDLERVPLDMRRVATGALMEHLMVDTQVGEVVWSSHDGTLCASALHEYHPRVELELGVALMRAELTQDGSLLYALSERGELLIVAWSASRSVVHRTEVEALDICSDARHVCHGLVLRGSEVRLKSLT